MATGTCYEHGRMGQRGTRIGLQPRFELHERVQVGGDVDRMPQGTYDLNRRVLPWGGARMDNLTEHVRKAERRWRRWAGLRRPPRGDKGEQLLIELDTALG